jgi:hypothetical protein
MKRWAIGEMWYSPAMWNEISAELGLVIVAILGFLWFYHRLNKPEPEPKPAPPEPKPFRKVQRPDRSGGLMPWVIYAIDRFAGWLWDDPRF